MPAVTPPAHPVVAREEALRLAMLAGDADALAGLLDDGLIFVGPDGQVADKATDLALHRSGRVRFTRLDFEDPPYASGEGGAVWVRRTADAAVTVDGQPSTARLEYLRVWVERPEGWRVAAGYVRILGSPPAPEVEPDTSRLEAEIQESVEALYAVFARYAPTWPMDISPYKDAERVRALEEKPLRELTAEDLGYYAGSAIWTMGSDEDLRYFFPRIAELMHREDVGSTDWEMHARKLAPGLAGAELDAVRRLYRAIWLAVVHDWWNRYQVTAADVLAGAAHLGVDPADLATVFEPCAVRAAARRMVESAFWLTCYLRDDARHAGTPRGLGMQRVEPALRDWLVRDGTLAALLQAQHRFPEPQFEHEGSTAGAATCALVALRRAEGH